MSADSDNIRIKYYDLISGSLLLETVLGPDEYRGIRRYIQVGQKVYQTGVYYVEGDYYKVWVTEVIDSSLVTISQFQKEIHDWSVKNFGENVVIQYDIVPLLRMMSEIGNISHGILKLSQGIRGSEDTHIENIRDATNNLAIALAEFSRGCRDLMNNSTQVNISSFLGIIEEVGESANAILNRNIDGVIDGIADTLVYLLDFCGRNNLNAEAILNNTWSDVKQRDWKKNSNTGQI